MEYRKVIQLKDGRMCVLRNGTEEDGQALLDIFLLTHSQTDYLLTYPDEANMTADQEAAFLKEKTESEDEIEILAEVDDIVVGSAGIAWTRYAARYLAKNTFLRRGARKTPSLKESDKEICM